jgi:hypothetical protein
MSISERLSWLDLEIHEVGHHASGEWWLMFVILLRVCTVGPLGRPILLLNIKMCSSVHLREKNDPMALNLGVP